MTRKKSTKTEIVYRNVYRKELVFIDNMKPSYTTPKLYIPKKDGKPTVEKGSIWYVYYYYRDPDTGKYPNRPFLYKAGINRLKTVAERKAFGKKLIKRLSYHLENGFSPYGKIEKTENSKLTIEEAIQYAYENKKSDWKESTAYDIKSRKNQFIDWCKEKYIHLHPIVDFKKEYVTNYLNDLAKSGSARNVNNCRSAISTLFTKLVDDEILESNIWLTTRKKKTDPKQNKPFTANELNKLRDYLLENDYHLYKFLSLVAYSFLRPIEVIRLQVENVDLNEGLLSVETKTSGKNNKHTLRIIDKAKPIFESFNLEQFNKKDFIFTPTEKPGIWETLERDKVGYFGKRFRKVKKILELPDDCTVYSMRHTVAVNIYNGLINNGHTEREAILKMLPITRHKNESGLRNYLRNVNAFLPKDYSDSISIDF